jgi:hypothetical protein
MRRPEGISSVKRLSGELTHGKAEAVRREGPGEHWIARNARAETQPRGIRNAILTSEVRPAWRSRSIAFGIKRLGVGHFGPSRDRRSTAPRGRDSFRLVPQRPRYERLCRLIRDHPRETRCTRGALNVSSCRTAGDTLGHLAVNENINAGKAFVTLADRVGRAVTSGARTP